MKSCCRYASCNLLSFRPTRQDCQPSCRLRNGLLGAQGLPGAQGLLGELSRLPAKFHATGRASKLKHIRMSDTRFRRAPQAGMRLSSVNRSSRMSVVSGGDVTPAGSGGGRARLGQGKRRYQLNR